MSYAFVAANVVLWLGSQGFRTDGPIQAFAVSPDGRRIVCARDGNWFDVLDPFGNPVSSGRASDGDQLRVLAFSPDGKTLAGGIGESSTVWLWDAGTGEQHLSVNANPDGVQSLAFSPDGKLLACGGVDDGTVRVIDPTSRETVIAIGVHRDRDGVSVPTVSYHSSGRFFVAGASANNREVNPALCRVGRPLPFVRDLTNLGAVSSGIVTFRPDGRVVYVAAKQAVWAVEMSSGRCRWKAGPVEEISQFLAVSDDGRLLAGADEYRLRVWDADTGTVIATWQPHAGEIVGLAAGGGRLFTAGDDRSVRVWPWPNAPQRQRVRLTNSEAVVLAVALTGGDAPAAFDAVRKLSSDPATVALARTHVGPVPRPTKEVTRRVQALLWRFESDDFDDRQSASRQMTALGVSVLPELRRAYQATDDAEVKARLTDALRHHQRAEEVAEIVSARWLEVLERINTPEAVALVKVVAGGDPDHPRTEDAADTLARMTGRRKSGGRGEQNRR